VYTYKVSEYVKCICLRNQNLSTPDIWIVCHCNQNNCWFINLETKLILREQTLPVLRNVLIRHSKAKTL